MTAAYSFKEVSWFQLLLFLAGTVLGLGFNMRIMLLTH